MFCNDGSGDGFSVCSISGKQVSECDQSEVPLMLSDVHIYPPFVQASKLEYLLMKCFQILHDEKCLCDGRVVTCPSCCAERKVSFNVWNKSSSLDSAPQDCSEIEFLYGTILVRQTVIPAFHHCVMVLVVEI